MKLYLDIAEKKNFYLAGKESKYAYYCHNMDELRSVTDQILPGECFMMSLKL